MAIRHLIHGGFRLISDFDFTLLAMAMALALPSLTLPDRVIEFISNTNFILSNAL
jgi:hypothetical protein